MEKKKDNNSEDKKPKLVPYPGKKVLPPSYYKPDGKPNPKNIPH